MKADCDPRKQQVEALERLAKEHGLLRNETEELSKLPNFKRPLIKIPSDERELIDFCKECGVELGKEDRLFRRDRTVVAINKERARLDIMTPRAMCSFAQRYIQFFKFNVVENENGEKERQIAVKNIATETAGKLLESWELLEKLPEIRRVNPTRLPVFRDDGRIDLLRPGYFAEQGIYTVDDGIEYDEGMTRQDSVAVIEDLLKDFPFLNDRSRASAVAAMLTMFCATMLSPRVLRPGFIYIANAPGAGKTLLCKIAIVPVAGICELRTLPRKEETRKVLDALALDASIYALFDNIRGMIQSEDVEAFITSATWGGRMLGESARFRVDNVATVFMTGNQTRTSDDMAERCLFVELFIQEADNRDRIIPQDRVIDERFLAERAKRARILSALWALVRAWEAEGKPAPAVPMQRFEEWSRVVAGIVISAGFGDPLEKPDISSGADVERRDMHLLVEKLAPRAESEGEEPPIRQVWRFDEIVEHIKEHGLFEDVEIWSGRQQRDIWEKDGSITQAGKSFFGKLLVRFDRRLFRTEDSRRLRFKAEGKGNNRKYVVELV